ncbi:MAG TPA: branched-chain amino acid ABC transporter permease [Gaiellaceae bacterium]|nr:branched-chain amino acid ABC transporter permease [Gaiellaceae bacterium]
MTELVQTIVLGLLIGGVYALAASGLTLIFGVMNVINVAHGAFLILAAYVTFAVWTRTGIDPLVFALATTPAMFALGWLVYKLLVSRIAGAPASMSVLLTFAFALVIEGILGLVYKGVFRAMTPSYFDESFHLGGLFFPKAQVYAAALAVGLLVLLYLVLTRTWLGRAIRASAQNPSGARLVGVDPGAVAALTFALGIATTGAAGSAIGVLYPFFPAAHYAWISRLLGIIVLGGMGSLPGALVGAMLLGVAETTTSTYFSVRWATAVPYVLILVVLLLRPHGLFGERVREDVVTA